MWRRSRRIGSVAAAVIVVWVSAQISHSGDRSSDRPHWKSTAAPEDRRRQAGETTPTSWRALLNSLRLTEVMYSPSDGGAEFLEIANTGGQSLAIGGVEFTNGIDFTFPPGTTLAPGEHVVIAASEEDFASAYPGVPLMGVYTGALSNGGERLTIESPGGWRLLTLRYDDDVPWPTDADGLGNSMVIADADAEPGDPTNWCASADIMGSPGTPESQACPAWDDPTDDIFDPDRLLDVRIQMDAADFEMLRLQERNIIDLLGDEDCLAEPFGTPFTYFPGTVEIDGVVVERVGIRKKGFLGSLSRDKPSLKVKFAEYVDGQRLSGLRRMTLNNAQQDPSFINQCLGYRLFSAAGVPAPRCNFAVVTVNDESLGLYVHVESVRERFIARHFDSITGDLFEGTLSDFRPGWTGTFELKGNEGDGDRTVLEDMVLALEAPDDELVEGLGELIDLDGFITFWAMEVLVGHWDGYAGNTNNFFVYHDPTDDLLTFIPWGADALFGGGQGAAAVAATSALARRLYLNQPTRDRYVDRMLDLLDTVWHEPTILDEIDRMTDLIEPHLDTDLTEGFEASIDNLETFVTARRDQMMQALVPEPPPWNEPLRDPLCFRIAGDLSGTFETTWGPLGRDAFQEGSGSLEITYDGQRPPVRQVGALVGPGENPDRAASFAMVAVTWEGKVIVIWIETDPTLIAAGATIRIGESPTVGFLLYIDPEVSPEPQLLGILGDGELHFDDAEISDGGAVSGTIESLIFGLFF